jgi:uncharacterized protein YoaH (UPF0181 family)
MDTNVLLKAMGLAQQMLQADREREREFGLQKRRLDMAGEQDQWQRDRDLRESNRQMWLDAEERRRWEAEQKWNREKAEESRKAGFRGDVLSRFPQILKDAGTLTPEGYDSLYQSQKPLFEQAGLPNLLPAPGQREVSFQVDNPVARLLQAVSQTAPSEVMRQSVGEAARQMPATLTGTRQEMFNPLAPTITPAQRSKWVGDINRLLGQGYTGQEAISWLRSLDPSFDPQSLPSDVLQRMTPKAQSGIDRDRATAAYTGARTTGQNLQNDWLTIRNRFAEERFQADLDKIEAAIGYQNAQASLVPSRRAVNEATAAYLRLQPEFKRKGLDLEAQALGARLADILADNARADAAQKETERHNRVAEEQGAQRIAISGAKGSGGDADVAKSDLATARAREKSLRAMLDDPQKKAMGMAMDPQWETKKRAELREVMAAINRHRAALKQGGRPLPSKPVSSQENQIRRIMAKGYSRAEALRLIRQHQSR